MFIQQLGFRSKRVDVICRYVVSSGLQEMDVGRHLVKISGIFWRNVSLLI